jgi:hypothetical protein
MADDQKIRPLFPGAITAADENSTAEVMAQNLEAVASQLRSGELQIQYGILSVMKSNRSAQTFAVGDSTYHQAILLLDLAHALEMKALQDG